jgi:autotransporter translocation and assembly factor TamB
VAAPQYGVRLREGTLRAELDDTALNLREFRIRAGDGYLTATGVMSRRTDGSAKLEWRAQDFQVLDQPDMRLRVAGSGTVGLEAKKSSSEISD